MRVLVSSGGGLNCSHRIPVEIVWLRFFHAFLFVGAEGIEGSGNDPPAQAVADIQPFPELETATGGPARGMRHQGIGHVVGPARHETGAVQRVGHAEPRDIGPENGVIRGLGGVGSGLWAWDERRPPVAARRDRCADRRRVSDTRSTGCGAEVNMR